jgi:hypothetical protein
MNAFIRPLIVAALLLPACQTSEGNVEPQAEVVPSYDNGLPKFDTCAEAIEFAVKEESLAKYKGGVFGSEYFKVRLPSGALTNNWVINCYFRELFRPYGSDAYRELALLLTHEHEFVQIGAYSVLNIQDVRARTQATCQAERSGAGRDHESLPRHSRE